MCMNKCKLWEATPAEWDAVSYQRQETAPEDVAEFKDKQVGGDHYSKQAIQPIDFITANGLGFCEGNAIKYICRYKDKNGVEDLLKAIHYLEMLVEQEGK